MADFVGGLATAIGTAVVGGIGAWIAKEIRNHDAEQLRQSVIRQAQDEISMIDAWVKAHVALSSASQLSDPIRDRAQRDLAAVYTKMQEASAQASRHRQLSFRDVLLRIFLRHLPVHG